MVQTKLTETVYVFCISLLKLVYLNLLWFLFTLFGLGIFGIFPATAALCRIQQQWLIEKNNSSPIFLFYWREYKRNFLRVNMLAVTLFLIGFILYFDLKFFVHKGGMINQIISLGIYILSIWYMIVLLYILPTYTAYRLKLYKYIQYAFIIGMLNPLKTLGLAIAAGGMMYLSLYFPQILFSLGVSVTFFIIMNVGGQAIHQVTVLKGKFSY
ncbi:DUF624 domain-containing protein [Lederbergia sp. NSJ-179]|uniref:YesL family protein n=1 Tax=Lederbergia sp. NSJ-179 TaxID=2931402 RepID=UPI001FD58A07|nr:DUF624 domain-containing protein [Lederbergia sp. NSJ-179]MCJ7843245.1 DUF624 domain-containing protein [Lederbergia sp. NSJ-179]